MAQELSFEEVFQQLRQQDEAAAAEVFQRFARRLIGLANHHLTGRVRQKVDPEDVVQSVFRTVFNRLAKGQFDIAGWDSLWGLLTRITVRKCHKWTDYYHAAARDLDREMARQVKSSDSSGSWDFLDREPSPSEVAVFSETLEKVLEGLDERERQIVALSLEGIPVLKITAQLSCTQSKVYRVLKLIRSRLERARDDRIEF
jgi:RNA polymerase sigma-70 factor (ECF subfamily)